MANNFEKETKGLTEYLQWQRAHIDTDNLWSVNNWYERIQEKLNKKWGSLEDKKGRGIMSCTRIMLKGCMAMERTNYKRN